MGMAAAEDSDATSNRRRNRITWMVTQCWMGMGAAVAIVVGAMIVGVVLLAQCSSTRNRWHSIAEDLGMMLCKTVEWGVRNQNKIRL